MIFGRRLRKKKLFQPPKRKILLNPGPLTTTDSVKRALIVSDICPREEEFGRLILSISQDLKRVVHAGDDYESVLFSGSGTAAVESVLSSVVADNEAILVLDNGAYGQRMLEICSIHYRPDQVFHLKASHTKVINPSIVETLLKAHPNISYVAVVHHETTTGLVNPIDDILKLTKKYKAAIVVDAMSSFGGIPINVTNNPYDFLISSSNKCLQGMPGLSFVVFKGEYAQKARMLKPKSLYLDLWKQYDFFNKYHQMQFTPPTQVCFALKQALKEYFEEGEAARYSRYEQSWKVLVRGIQDLGLKLFLPMQLQSKLLTAIKIPEAAQYSFDGMHDYLQDRDITIYPGKTSEADTFRVANIGAIDHNDITIFLDHLKNYLKFEDSQL